MKKYELTTNTKVFDGKTLYQIRALVSFGTVNAGDLGGYIEKEDTLSQAGTAWVCGNAWVSDNAWVCGDAWVCDNARVRGNAWVYGDAQVRGDARVSGNARVSDNARVYGNADYLTIGPIGSRGDTTTFYRRRDGGTMVVCGCYHDTIDAFEARVKEVHHGTSHEAAYLAAVACARARVRTKPEEEA